MKASNSAFVKLKGFGMLGVGQAGPLSAQAQATSFVAPAKFPQMARWHLWGPQGCALALPVVSHRPCLAPWPASEALQALEPFLSPLQSAEPWW